MSDFRNKLLKNIVFLLIATAVFSVFLVLLKFNIDHQLEVIKNLKSYKQSLSHSTKNLALLIRQWEVAKKYKEKVNLLVPNKDSLVALAKDFQKIAEEKDVRLSFNFGKEIKSQSSQILNSVSFTAVIEGESFNLIRFLEELEKKYYSLRIDSLDITGSGNNFLKAEMNGQIFFSS